MLKRICLALTLLTGCREAKAPAPTEPGTSVPVAYPAVLIGQGSVDVRDDAEALTTSTLASTLNFVERRLLDSNGAIYNILNAVQVGPATQWWLDMGTSQRAYFLELEPQKGSSLDDAKALVLEQVRSPLGVWEGDPRAVERVRGFQSIAELIEGCRSSWEWSR